jgi:hypothetical protein
MINGKTADLLAHHIGGKSLVHGFDYSLVLDGCMGSNPVPGLHLTARLCLDQLSGSVYL